MFIFMSAGWIHAHHRLRSRKWHARKNSPVTSPRFPGWVTPPLTPCSPCCPCVAAHGYLHYDRLLDEQQRQHCELWLSDLYRRGLRVPDLQLVPRQAGQARCLGQVTRFDESRGSALLAFDSRLLPSIWLAFSLNPLFSFLREGFVAPLTIVTLRSCNSWSVPTRTRRTDLVWRRFWSLARKVTSRSCDCWSKRVPTSTLHMFTVVSNPSIYWTSCFKNWTTRNRHHHDQTS